MPTSRINHIDLTEVLEHLPAYSQGRYELIQLRTIPSQFADDTMWHFYRLVTNSLSNVKLRPDDLATQVWSAENAYPDGLPVEPLSNMIHFYLCLVDGLLNEALQFPLEDCWTYSTAPFRELKLFEAIEDRLSVPVDPAPLDYWMVTVLAIYQYDKLFGLLSEGRVDEACYVMDDIARIRCDLAGRDVNHAIQDWKSTAASRAAKELHRASNERKQKAISEWEQALAHATERGAKRPAIAAFARKTHEKYHVVQETVRDWIRDHEKTKKVVLARRP